MVYKFRPVQLIAVCKGCGAEMKGGALANDEYKKRGMQNSPDQTSTPGSRRFSGHSAFLSPAISSPGTPISNQFVSCFQFLFYFKNPSVVYWQTNVLKMLILYYQKYSYDELQRVFIFTRKMVYQINPNLVFSEIDINLKFLLFLMSVIELVIIISFYLSGI